MQRGLFDPDENGTGGDKATQTVAAPLCRNTDPQTSHRGAVYAEELRDRHKRAVLDVADAVPRTANELAVRVIQRGGQWNQETLRKRVREQSDEDGETHGAHSSNETGEESNKYYREQTISSPLTTGRRPSSEERGRLSLNQRFSCWGRAGPFCRRSRG